MHLVGLIIFTSPLHWRLCVSLFLSFLLTLSHSYSLSVYAHARNHVNKHKHHPLFSIRKNYNKYFGFVGIKRAKPPMLVRQRRTE